MWGMSLLLLAAAAAALQPKPPAEAPPKIAAQAQTAATVQIVDPVSFTEKAWKKSPDRNERLFRDAQGTTVRMRTIDFQ